MKRILTSLLLLSGLLAVPSMTHAAPLIPQDLLNDPSNIHLSTIPAILNVFIRLGLLFAAAIGGIFIVVSGYQYVMSAGNPEKLEKAKMGLTWSIGGFVLAISSYAIVLLTENVLRTTNDVRVDQSFNPGSDIKVPKTPASILEQIMDLLLIFAGAAAVLFLILGGYRYVTSQGNPDLAEKAKKTMLYSVVGLIVTMLATVIFMTLKSQLGLKQLNIVS